MYTWTETLWRPTEDLTIPLFKSGVTRLEVWKLERNVTNGWSIRRTLCFCTPSPRVQNTSPMTHKPIELSSKVVMEGLIQPATPMPAEWQHTSGEVLSNFMEPWRVHTRWLAWKRRNCPTNVFVFKVLEGMPASFFQPVGEETLHRYNDMYQCNWGLEWSDYCLAYLVYICTVSMYNYSHPKFLRTAPEALQVINKA